VEVVYEREEVQEKVDHSLVAVIDIGANNLVALTSNKVGFVPRLVNKEVCTNRALSVKSMQM